MTDNVVASAAVGTGATFATDDDGTAHHPYVKIEFGADNTQTPVSSSNPLPVGDAGGSLTVDGTVAISGTVAVTDNSGTLSVDDGGGNLSIDDGGNRSPLMARSRSQGRSRFPARAAPSASPAPCDQQCRRFRRHNRDRGDQQRRGSVGITGTVTSSAGGSVGITGTVATSSAVTSVIPGTGATNLGKAEDAIFADADVGVMALAVRKNTAASTSGSDGDYQPLITNTTGHLWVDASGQTLTVSSSGGSVGVTGTVTVSSSGGSITANAGTNLNTSLLALDATAAKLNVAQAAALGSNTGPLIQGSVTTNNPSYTTGQIDPLSLTTAGGLRVDCSGTSVQLAAGTATVGVAIVADQTSVVYSGTTASRRSLP
jgi:hypothetical protein